MDNKEAVKNLERWVHGETLTEEEKVGIEWLIADFQVMVDGVN
jgi:hypothetical protein